MGTLKVVFCLLLLSLNLGSCYHCMNDEEGEKSIWVNSVGAPYNTDEAISKQTYIEMGYEIRPIQMYWQYVVGVSFVLCCIFVPGYIYVFFFWVLIFGISLHSQK